MRTSMQLHALRPWANALAASALVLGMLGAGQAVAAAGDSDVRNTKHNLGTSTSTATRTNYLSAGTDEICVFCHTPHGANTSVSAPLWNKGLPGTTYTTYSTSTSSTLDGQVLAVGSVSLACLSCHDGTQAMDNMVNAPGSGGYTLGGAVPTGYTWNGSSQITGVANLTGDLTNDHPIGIQYCGGGLTAGGGGACADADFRAAQTAVINSSRVWWVDTSVGTPGTRQRTDMVLYSRNFGGTVGVNPSVECGSCHDPHATPYAANQVAFLRVSNAASGVCLACHVK